ncbi:MAG TPA: ECF transporter S component [Bacillota bacterium]|nr:ECF transporter S component [Bacillota bacterium]HPJ23460.1 ECF transporter S component [Bacillota bacterium]
MEKKVLTKKERIREMTMLALFIAIIALLGLTPAPYGTTLGFFRVYGQVEATIIHIPVLVGAALFGKRFGIYLGLAFGVVSNIAAFIYSPYFFIYPWVAILPRLAFGFLIVYFVDFSLKIFKNKYIAVGVSFFVLTLVHAVMTLGMLYTVFPMVMELPYNWTTFGYYFTWLAINAGVPWITLGEAVLAGIVGGTIVIRLAKTQNIKKYISTEGVE